MPIFQCEFFSRTMGQETVVSVLLPEVPPPPQGYPVLYLLHGLSENNHSWLRKTLLENVSRDLKSPLLVVMPDLGRSGGGGVFWNYLTTELPGLVERYAKIDARRQSTFVAGQSFGGYASLRWALKHPEKFQMIGAIAPCIGLERLIKDSPWKEALRPEWQFFFGNPFPADCEVINLVEQQSGKDLPGIYLRCGTGDFLYNANVDLAAAFKQFNLDADVEFNQGEHSWAYFQQELPGMLGKFIACLEK